MKVPAEYDVSLKDFQRLDSALQHARRRLRRDPQAAAGAALLALRKFINSVPRLEIQNLSAALWPLELALHDLRLGKVSPIFRPAKRVRNRPTDLSSRQLLTGYAVYLVDVLLRSGLSVERACNKIAASLRKENFAIDGRVGTPDWKTVKGWRDRISKLPKDDQRRDLVEHLRTLDPLKDCKTADDALARAPKLMRAMVEQIVTRSALE